jgi:hypothetical protein
MQQMLQGSISQSDAIYNTNLCVMETILDIINKSECSKSGETVHNLAGTTLWRWKSHNTEEVEMAVNPFSATRFW